MAVVSITVTGDPLYGLCAHQTVRSVLDHTDFDVIVSCDTANGALLPRSERVRIVPVRHRDGHRAEPFLTKFDAWRACLDRSDDELVVHLDADAAIVAPITDDDLRDVLGVKHLAMVEQTGITGSTMDRASFLRHYLDHSHRYLVPDLPEPSLADFRFHNSGVILFRRNELRNLVDWYDDLRRDRPDHHTVGEHMIADQDYLQVWTNVVRPGACADLDPMWNHCPWWDESFPAPTARVVHLSNFCNGPPMPTALALQDHRRRGLDDAARGEWRDLSFCIVTYRSGDVIGDCIDALSRFEGAEIVVVDNHSDDETLAVLSDRGIVADRTSSNLGFAVAANRAARLATRSVLVFVNPDCFVHLDALDGVVERLVPGDDVVLVADYVHEDGSLVAGDQPGYTRAKVVSDVLMNTPFESLATTVAAAPVLHDESWSWPLAACMAVRRDAFERVGGFDERYFCYMEDVEFGRALHARGGRVESLGSTVVHLGRRGVDMDDRERDRLLDDARIAYARHNHGRSTGGMLRVVARVGEIAERRRRRS